ncbi:hypothetical protein LCGC14_3047820 [marine sediment metagenome]|uniref:Uncharacterized protein n=1 Tax=marine sediment metagenome TaxID=412755 RepID=A0A0F8ZDI8_9ZZZZ
MTEEGRFRLSRKVGFLRPIILRSYETPPAARVYHVNPDGTETFIRIDKPVEFNVKTLLRRPKKE